jgi:hypothetical protein
MCVWNGETRMVTIDIHVNIVHDMFVACYILHNMSIKEDDEVDVDELIRHM